MADAANSVLRQPNDIRTMTVVQHSGCRGWGKKIKLDGGTTMKKMKKWREI
jgi:hypothetical protein